MSLTRPLLAMLLGMLAAPGATTLYRIDDGTVWIDWRTAETLAASKADRTVLSIAQLMLAIRDGNWKPLPR